mgnify:FL=1
MLPGQWAVVVFKLIPKNGFGHLLFPHLWGERAERRVWRVARHGELPEDTFLFDSREHAAETVEAAFPGPGPLPMGWVEVPSDDYRRRGGMS